MLSLSQNACIMKGSKCHSLRRLVIIPASSQCMQLIGSIGLHKWLVGLFMTDIVSDNQLCCSAQLQQLAQMSIIALGVEPKQSIISLRKEKSSRYRGCVETQTRGPTNL